MKLPIVAYLPGDLDLNTVSHQSVRDEATDTYPTGIGVLYPAASFCNHRNQIKIARWFHYLNSPGLFSQDFPSLISQSFELTLPNPIFCQPLIGLSSSITSVVKLLPTQISPQKSEDRVCLKLLIYCVMSDILPGYT